jgi:hypothetical protein
VRGEGEGFRADLDRRPAERVGGLERMPPLHASATPLAATDVDAEAPGDRPHGRYVFLVLVGDALLDEMTARAVRAPCGRRRVERFVDVLRDRPRGALAVRLAGLAAGALRGRLRLAFGEGRGLPLARAIALFERGPKLRVLGLEPLEARAVVAVGMAHLALAHSEGSIAISAGSTPG